MAYQVLARKYRPQTFAEVVGQQHVTLTLQNAILQKRLHHAYLFTGVRGTGKTSLARIFAKSLNCERGPTVEPCGVCSRCIAINKGQFLDVLEIDGASNTSVESVRELREQVKYTPAAGQYKIYIIDEVHMLSTSAFNALLKTLEEPPPHVIFLFATTEVHKIPLTILSRCQRFDLRRLSQLQISEYLQKICLQESVVSDTPSLALLARSAEGSMRDAISLLDTAIGLSGACLAEEKLLTMLGWVQSNQIEDLTRDCIAGNLSQALKRVEDLYQRGFDLKQVVLQWVEYLHDLTLLKAAGPESLPESISSDALALMQAMVASVDLSDLQVMFQTVYRSAETLARSDAPKILLDLLLVRLVHGAPFQSLTALLGTTSSEAVTRGVSASTSSLATGSGLDSKLVVESKPQPLPQKINLGSEPFGSPSKTPAASVKEASSVNPALPEMISDPHMGRELLERALKKQPALKAVVGHAQGVFWEEGKCVLVFERGSFGIEMMEEKRAVLSQVLSSEWGRPISVVIRESAPTAPLAEKAPVSSAPEVTDPLVRQAMQMFNATVKEVKKYEP